MVFYNLPKFTQFLNCSALKGRVPALSQCKENAYERAEFTAEKGHEYPLFNQNKSRVMTTVVTQHD